MPYLVDSDCIIDHLDEVAGAEQFLATLAPHGIAISVVTYMEVCRAPATLPDPARRDARLRALLNIVPILDVTKEVAERCADVKLDLRRRGHDVRRRALDLIVAATALEHGLILVTYNVDHYRDVTGLTILVPSYRQSAASSPHP